MSLISEHIEDMSVCHSCQSTSRTCQCHSCQSTSRTCRFVTHIRTHQGHVSVSLMSEHIEDMLVCHSCQNTSRTCWCITDVRTRRGHVGVSLMSEHVEDMLVCHSCQNRSRTHASMFIYPGPPYRRFKSMGRHCNVPILHLFIVQVLR